MGNLLNKEMLLARDTLKVVKVEFEDGNFVYVRQMTGRERDIFEQSIMRAKKNAKGHVETYETVLEDFRAKLAVVTVCDEKGELLLSPGDVSTLSKNMSAAKLEKIINEAQKINAITEEDKEDLIKN